MKPRKLVLALKAAGPTQKQSEKPADGAQPRRNQVRPLG
jgi:hypothetical protein